MHATSCRTSRWSDLPDAVWDACLARALAHRRDRRWTDTARGKALGLLFFNPSLRTRTSMELAAAHLGAFPTVLTPGQGTWNLEWRDGVRMDADKAEHVREAIGVLSRYVDALGVRTFASLTDRDADRADAAFHAVVAASDVPVVNLESARWHPCQALADAAALREQFGGDVRGKKFVLTWAPHPSPLPRAVPNSALLMAARLGMEVVVARPEGFALDAEVQALAAETAARCGGSVSEIEDRDAAFDGAHVVYAKAWAGEAVYDDRAAEAARRTALDALARDGANDGRHRRRRVHALLARPPRSRRGRRRARRTARAPFVPGRVPTSRAEGDTGVDLEPPSLCAMSSTVIKLGGALLDHPDALAALWSGVAELCTAGPVVVVHGGGPQATALARRLGHEPRFVAGRRVTTDLDLDIALWTMRGALNARLVASARATGIPAVGAVRRGRRAGESRAAPAQDGGWRRWSISDSSAT